MSANGSGHLGAPGGRDARKRRNAPGAPAPRRSARCLRTAARSDVSPSSPTRPQPRRAPARPRLRSLGVRSIVHIVVPSYYSRFSPRVFPPQRSSASVVVTPRRPPREVCDAMRATAASFLLDGVAVAASPARRYRTSPRRLAPPVSRETPIGRATAAAADDVAAALDAAVRDVRQLPVARGEQLRGACARARCLRRSRPGAGSALPGVRARTSTPNPWRGRGHRAPRVAQPRRRLRGRADRASTRWSSTGSPPRRRSRSGSGARPTAARILDMQDLPRCGAPGTTP